MQLLPAKLHPVPIPGENFQRPMQHTNCSPMGAVSVAISAILSFDVCVEDVSRIWQVELIYQKSLTQASLMKADLYFIQLIS
jgi:hypothetical protein